MKISDILSADDVCTVVGIEAKKALLDAAGEKLAKKTGVDKLTMFDVIQERENLGSTAFGGGTALPHGRIPGLSNLKGLFVRLDKGIDFNAADGKPVDLLFFLVSPENSGADHLSALAQISKILKDENRCAEIRNAKTAADIYRLLTAA